ncbi:MAG: tetratricopeptide repeat protein [Treponema sp.]|nr:tetratricopeptide repeat protein [Treponema sp.]
MKKKLLAVSLAAFLAAGGFASELDIYNELNIYSNAEYYPGVIEKAEQLEKNYPESVFIVTARIAKGQALTILNRYEEAEETFATVLSSLRFGAEDYAKCWYYLGLAYYFDGDYTNAISAFHTACDVEQRENKLEYYHSSILYAGRINFFMELYEKSIPLFEYVVSNGTYFSKPEYDEALQKLLFAYNSAGNYNNTIKLYSKLDEQDFSESVYSALTIYTADAYEKTGNVQLAYSTLNKNQNEDFKEMLSVFRLNLGAAAYAKKDYDTALEYFTLAEDSSVEANLITAFIYKQKIELDRNGKASAAGVKDALLDNQERIFASNIQGLSDSYYSLLMRCYAFTDDASSSIECYEKIEKPGAKDALVAATILSRRNKVQAENLIAPFIADSDCAKLYARLLSANQKYEKAEAVYVQLGKNKKMDGDSYIEYAKVLYRLKKWEEALAALKGQTQHPLYSYLTGLCRYNLKSYITAYAYLDSYTTSKASEPGYKKIAHFYKSVCEYKEGRYENAYADLSAYVKTYTTQDEYLYRAYELGAKSALMQSDFKNAVFMARGMITSSQSVSQKQNAVIYCSEILTDSKDYDGAIKLLSEYTTEKSDFAVRCILATAKVYEKQGELAKADSSYQQIVRDYSGTAYAEDAAYRSGEIFYAAQSYKEAETRFTKYIYNYVNGKYSDAAYYFSGDCNMKNGELDKAIMQNTTLVSKYPDSIYSYGAYKNLLQAYYTQENYRDALSTARLLVRNYNEQARSDGISSKVLELERIVSGTDRTIVEKEGEYDRAGKTASKKGRAAGSELVQLYAQHDENTKAFELAIELLNYQKDGDEMYYAAQNADFAAGYYYNKGESQKAAEYYLKAAEYYRSSGQDDDDKAAAALYSAVDSFMAAGLKGDAQVTANLLVELYPETKQGKKVMNLIK